MNDLEKEQARIKEEVASATVSRVEEREDIKLFRVQSKDTVPDRGEPVWSNDVEANNKEEAREKTLNSMLESLSAPSI